MLRYHLDKTIVDSLMSLIPDFRMHLLRYLNIYSNLPIIKKCILDIPFDSLLFFILRICSIQPPFSGKQMQNFLNILNHYILFHFMISIYLSIWTYTIHMQSRKLVPVLGQEDPLEEGMATQCRILAWRIPWMEKPGGLQSTGSQRVGHD